MAEQHLCHCWQKKLHQQTTQNMISRTLSTSMHDYRGPLSLSQCRYVVLADERHSQWHMIYDRERSIIAELGRRQ